MNGTSPRILKAIPLILVLLTSLSCPAFSGDIQAMIKMAESGDPDAQFKLGIAYVNGESVPKDNAVAVKWFRKAAEQGHADAQRNLGFAYADGLSGTPDYAETGVTSCGQ